MVSGSMPLGRSRRHEFGFPHFGPGRGGRTRPRAEARQRSPFALRQSATSHRPRAKEPRVRPSSATAVRSQIPMPAPNRRCNFSMTGPSRRIIGAKLADAECRVKCVLFIDVDRLPAVRPGLRLLALDRPARVRVLLRRLGRRVRPDLVRRPSLLDRRLLRLGHALARRPETNPRPGPTVR